MRVFGTQLQGQSPLRTPVVPVSWYRAVEIKRFQTTSCHSALAQAGALRSNHASRRNWRCGSYDIEVKCDYLSLAVRAPTKPRQRWACVVQIQRHASFLTRCRFEGNVAHLRDVDAEFKNRALRG
jgi:hypothetical protein